MKTDREKKIEYVSSVTVAIIILLTGFTAFRESLDKTLHPAAADYSAVSLVIIAVAAAVKLIFGRYCKAAGKTCHSESLIASGTDSVMDAFISLSDRFGAC